MNVKQNNFKIKLLITFFISQFVFSQVTFEKGYFITNSDNRVECLIQNLDRKNNPDFFRYKINEDESLKIARINDVKLFEIYDQLKYVRSIVKFDLSSNDLNRLSEVESPNFVEREVFLKEVLKGDVSLYKFTEGNIDCFFYQEGNGKIEPLIYKIYEVEVGKIAFNEDYKIQLMMLLKCPTVTLKDIEKLQYKESFLKDIFVKYYNCSNSNFKDTSVEKVRGDFNMNIRPRLNFSSLDLKNDSNYNLNFDLKREIGFGLEIEYVLPFNKNKWAVIVEPTYQHFKSESVIGTVDYSSLELPVGFRYFMFFGDKSKMFLNGQIVVDFPLNSRIELKRKSDSTMSIFEVGSNLNFVCGIGYRYNDKFGVEARFFTNRNIMVNYLNWVSSFNNISLVLSYKIF